MVLDLLKIGLLENPTEESTKIEEFENKEKSTKILYNKKLLLIVGIVILAIIAYIYYFDISINIIGLLPSYNLFNKKKKNKNNTKNKDEFEEFSTDDESEIIDSWNLEVEIKNYMEKQHEYISNNLT